MAAQQVLTTKLLMIQVFWDVTLCRWVSGSRHSLEMLGTTQSIHNITVPDDVRVSLGQWFQAFFGNVGNHSINLQHHSA